MEKGTWSKTRDLLYTFACARGELVAYLHCSHPATGRAKKKPALRWFCTSACLIRPRKPRLISPFHYYKHKIETFLCAMESTPNLYYLWNETRLPSSTESMCCCSGGQQPPTFSRIQNNERGTGVAARRRANPAWWLAPSATRPCTLRRRRRRRRAGHKGMRHWSEGGAETDSATTRYKMGH